MPITLDIVEALAPDQASLKAASKQMSPKKWPLLARDEAGGLVWGECQGSGANPYRVIVDTDDHGYKCTCPSRKFPCKHALALMWMAAENAAAFAPAETPDWVRDWLGRRRKTSGPAAPESKSPAKSLAAATAEAEAPAPVDPKQEARRAAAAERRAEETERAIAAGLDELDQWIADQLRLGLAGFLGEIAERCRRIAARLVDAKASALAGRLDETPARILALPAEERPDAAIRELGKLALLTRAWRAAPRDPELRRAVGATETRDDLLADTTAPRVDGLWEVLAERVSTRRDGLIAQSTWLMSLTETEHPFALLLDFFPAATGRRGGAFSAGERFLAELVFYPAKRPLRAVIAKREPSPESDAPNWSALAATDPLATYLERQDAAPWSGAAPLLLPPGRLASAGARIWWRAASGSAALPVSGGAPDYALGLELEATAALWDGARCQLLAAQSRGWGRIGFDG